MIRKVAFQNFKVLADVELELEPFTVLVGPNASGKSTILDGLNRIAACRMAGGLVNPLISGINWSQSQVDSPETIITKGSRKQIRFHALQGESLNVFSVGFESHDRGSGWSQIRDPLGSKLLNGYTGSITLFSPTELDWLPKAIHLRLSGNKIAASSYSAVEIPKLLPAGQGLAAVLADIALRDGERYERIQEGLRQVVPTVKRIRLERAEVPERDWIDHELGPTADKTAIGNKIVVDLENAKGIPAEDVSEGTLFALAILTVATDVENDWLILLDDIERGLHPIACGDLVKVLKKLVKEFPTLQIVATTHSPYLLNFVEPEEVRVVALDEQGHSAVAKLTDHPDFDKWKEALFPGEFWGQVGENWVTKLSVKQ